MQGLSSNHVRLALLLLAGIVIAVVLGIMSGVPNSAAQTGTGYGPQDVPEQVINSTSGRHASRVGFAVGIGSAGAMLGGAALYGRHRQHHPHGHEYP
jgi:hypothetical protein